MAITKMMNIKTQSNLYNAIAYIMREEKTEESLWIGGNAGDNPEEVYRVMMQTKQDWEEGIPLCDQLESGGM